ncbi:MAG TPA: DUF433 domain-containing protein [Thermodesulfovibrionia bacterium]|nr:DUF433 domain-containing protein [Thermodesulfovibrionia bacterium]
MGETIYKPTVVRSDRGLSIAGTRITLYQIMDYIKANLPSEIIREHFRLTIKQTNDVLQYIENHRQEVEAEYEKIVKRSDEIRQYWQARNQKRFDEIAAKPPKPWQEKIRNKLQESRAMKNIK